MEVSSNKEGVNSLAASLMSFSLNRKIEMSEVTNWCYLNGSNLEKTLNKQGH